MPSRSAAELTLVMNHRLPRWWLPESSFMYPPRTAPGMKAKQ